MSIAVRLELFPPPPSPCSNWAGSLVADVELNLPAGALHRVVAVAPGEAQELKAAAAAPVLLHLAQQHAVVGGHGQLLRSPTT